LLVSVVTFDIAVNQRTADYILKFVVGTAYRGYRSLAADPPSVEFVDHAREAIASSAHPTA
jgi:hypothetical protein